MQVAAACCFSRHKQGEMPRPAQDICTPAQRHVCEGRDQMTRKSYKTVRMAFSYASLGLFGKVWKICQTSRCSASLSDRRFANEHYGLPQMAVMAQAAMHGKCIDRNNTKGGLETP